MTGDPDLDRITAVVVSIVHRAGSPRSSAALLQASLISDCT